MQRDPLKGRVALCLRGRVGDVQLVVDVDVEAEPGRLDCVDRLAGKGELDRLVQDPGAVRIDDGRALVADERLRGARRARARAAPIAPSARCKRSRAPRPPAPAASPRAYEDGSRSRRRSASGRGPSRRPRRREGSRQGGSGALDQERDDVRELLRRERVRIRPRHHVRVARCDVGAGIDDRGLHEVLE